MNKSILATLLIGSALMIGGCVNSAMPMPTVSQSDAQKMLTYQTGTVIGVRGVVIKDNGSGSLLGAVTGAVLGNMIGKGKGRTLATLTGGLVGAYAGAQTGAANAQELTVRLDNGNSVVVIAKGVRFSVGSRVKIVSNHGKVVSVEPL